MGANGKVRNVRASSGRGTVAALLSLLLAAGCIGQPMKFYPDDPLLSEPKPRHVNEAKFRSLSDYYEFLVYPFVPPGELNRRKPKGGKEPVYYRAQGVNTLGEVPDGSWYENRNYYRPMSKEEIQAGPGEVGPPDPNGQWLVISAKNEGITPGFTIQDARGRRYLLKFDPLDYSEMATAADTLVSKLFYALGYHVPENNIVHFNREQLRIDPKTKFRGADGESRAMTERDVTEILLRVPRAKDGRYRGSTSLYLPGTPLGPHRYFGTRRDDPNDTVPHEHRRDQRGLWVYCAWLGHDDSRAINSLDMLHEENGIRYVKHYLIDFGSTLGSASVRPNSPRSGNYLFSWKEVASQFFTFGLNIPGWAKAHYPNFPSIGRFEWQTFDPVTWRPEYINPAFENALPDDAFWAAKQVMALTDEQIRWAVESGEYSNPAAEAWVIECLIKRRDKIGRAFFSQVLPLDRFRVTNGELRFEDLAEKHRFGSGMNYRISWARFHNATGTETPITDATEFRLPPAAQNAETGSYLKARVVGDHEEKDIHVYLRREAEGWAVVGLDRGWVGKKNLKFAN
jgi:hypothetical protein